MAVNQICGKAWEDTSPYLMARIVSATNAVLQQADISSVTYSVFDLNDTTTPVISPASIPVSQIIFNSLQTDSRWTVDATGYNFAYALPAAALPEGGRSYVVDFNVTPVSGAPFPVVFLIHSLKRNYQTP